MLWRFTVKVDVIFTLNQQTGQNQTAFAQSQRRRKGFPIDILYEQY